MNHRKNNRLMAIPSQEKTNHTGDTIEIFDNDTPVS